MRSQNACCSFCRKSYQDVGPLVEGPGDRRWPRRERSVYICAQCVELCQSIIQQERRRRSASGPRSPSPSPEVVRARLDQLVGGQEEAKGALISAALRRHARLCAGQNVAAGDRELILFVGPSRSSKVYLARALAHVLEVPFTPGDAGALVKGSRGGAEVAVPILYDLLLAADFDIEAAGRGVVYVDGIDRREAQEALLNLWDANATDIVPKVKMDIRKILFICGGAFAGIEETATRMGRHAEQPVTGEILMALGVLPSLVGHLQSIARVAPLDEETLGRMIPWVDLGRVGSASAARQEASGG